MEKRDIQTFSPEDVIYPAGSYTGYGPSHMPPPPNSVRLLGT